MRFLKTIDTQQYLVYELGSILIGQRQAEPRAHALESWRIVEVLYAIARPYAAHVPIIDLPRTRRDLVCREHIYRDDAFQCMDRLGKGILLEGLKIDDDYPSTLLRKHPLPEPQVTGRYAAPTRIAGYSLTPRRSKADFLQATHYS